jgi:hypothetical protein
MAKQNLKNDPITAVILAKHDNAVKQANKVVLTGNLTGDKALKPTFDYIEKYTGEKTYLSTDSDVITKNYVKAQYNEAKKNSQDQGAISEFAGFLGQTVAGEIVMGAVSGAGYLLDFQHWGSKLMGGEGDWGNWMSDYAEKGKEWIQQVAPIYQDPDNANRSTWENALRGDGWWAQNGVSIASSLSILLPVAGWAKGVGMAGKGLSYVGQAARVGKWGGTLAKGVKTVDKVMDLFPVMGEGTKVALDGIHKAIVSRLIESQMEATGVFKDRYDYYLQQSGMSEQEARQAAGKAASFTYNANWAGLLTDIPQYMLMGTSGKLLKTALSKKLPGFITDSALLAKTAKVRSVGMNMFSEGAEEAYQYIISEEGKRMGDIHAGLVDANATTLGERLSGYSDQAELWTSALFGSLGGGVFAGLGPKATQLINKSFRKGEQFLTEADLRKREETDRHTVIAHNADLINKAANSGDEEAIHAAKSNMIFELAKNSVLVNNYDKARETMAQLKNATSEEKDLYGLSKDFESYVGNVNEFLGHMDAAADIVDRAKTKYTYGLAEAIARRQFDQYMYAQQSPVIKDKLNQEMRNVIPNMPSLSKDGNTAINELITIKGMEKAVSNYETLMSKKLVAQDDIAAVKAEIERSKALIQQRKESLNSIVKDNDALNDYDHLALKAIEGGTADDLISLSTKDHILDFKNRKTTEELNYLTSREGIRAFKANRAKAYKEQKEKLQTEKEKARQQSAAATVTTAEETQSQPKNIKDLNIKDVAAKIESGKAKFEDYADTPEDLLTLKKAVADFKNLHEQNPNIDAEEASEDAEIAPEDMISFSTPEEAQEEVVNEAEPIETVVDRDAVEDLDAELTDEDAHEVLEIPINPSDDTNWRIGDDLNDPKLSKIPSQLAWLSANNPEAKDVSEANKALAAFLEDPGTIVTEYEVTFDFNREYLKANKSNPTYVRIMQALTKGELPTITDVGYTPITATITKGGNPVTFKGQKLEMSLHDPSFFFKKNGDPKYKGISEYMAQVAILHKQAIVQQLANGNTIKAKLTGKSRGKLNLATGEDGEFAKKYVAQTLKKNVSKINFLVGSQTGSYVNAKKRPRLILGSNATPGAIYTEVSTANGSPFPLRLSVNNLNTAEATLIHAIYVDLLGTPDLLTGNISDGILKYITESKDPRIEGLNKYLSDLENMTYQDLLSHLVYEGSRTIAKGDFVLTHWVNTMKNGVALPNNVQFGKNRLTQERLEDATGKAAFIQWLTTNKRRQIDANKLDDVAYKEYLNNTQILTTNVEGTPEGHLFVQPVISYSTNMVISNAAEAVPEATEIVEEGKSYIVEGLKADLEFEKSSEFGGNPEIIAALESQIESLEEDTATKETPATTVSTIANTVRMFQAGVKTATGEEIKVILPDNEEFDENPC